MRRQKIFAVALLLSLLLVSCGEDRPEETNGTTEYGCPEWLTDRWRLEHEDPGRLRLDIAIPQVGEELGGAEELNARIGAEYAFYLDRGPEEYGICDLNFADPSLRIWYELYRWEDVFELCVFGREESLMGSGPLLWTSVYGYDLERDAVLTTEELLERLDYTPEDVVDRFYEEMVEPEDRENYTWEDIGYGWFYIDEAGELAFTVSLYG